MASDRQVNEHHFNLTGMNVGDKFIGCLKCNIQYPKNHIGILECPNCLGKMQLFIVTKEDVTGK